MDADAIDSLPCEEVTTKVVRWPKVEVDEMHLVPGLPKDRDQESEPKGK